MLSVLNRALFIGLMASLLGLLVLGSRLEEVGSKALLVQPAPVLDPISEVISEAPVRSSGSVVSRSPASLAPGVEVSSRLEIEPVTNDENSALNPGNSNGK